MVHEAALPRPKQSRTKATRAKREEMMCGHGPNVTVAHATEEAAAVKEKA